jgi:hypothetical protein
VGAVEPELVPAVVAGGVGEVGTDVLDGGVLARLGSAGQLAGFSRGVGGRLTVVAALSPCARRIIEITRLAEVLGERDIRDKPAA